MEERSCTYRLPKMAKFKLSISSEITMIFICRNLINKNHYFWLYFQIEWQPDYEPYIVAHNSIPSYDPRFTGFGWNKVSHVMEMYAQGYTFVVLPSAFIIHMPHAPSLEINQFRNSLQYRMCVIFYWA